MEMLSIGQQILASQPFSVLLGAQMTKFAPGEVELVLPLQPAFFQQFGFAHGGILSYLADNALTFAGGSVLGPAILTSGYTINYVKPAQGEVLIARSKVVASGSRQAVCNCEILAVSNGVEKLCAVAQGTIITRPEKNDDSL